ncbi:MAG: peptide chain release factor 2 [Dehalococcoidia bacterium]|nr:MAG: peptide chain release factor 2 [Dehalococcoidia bacterium]
MKELRDRVEELKQRISIAMVGLDINSKEKKITTLEKKAAKANFWRDSTEAQLEMRRLGKLKRVVEKWRKLEEEAHYISEVISMESKEEEASLDAEIQAEVDRIASNLGELEFQLTFSGKYDNHNAILAIHAGTGGVESQDWAQMLLRMYLRWAERQDYTTRILDTTPGEEAGIKSIVVEIRGDYSFGYLKSEHGVHRLIRLSPFDANHSRHTSFVLVEVMPEAEEDIDMKVLPEDIRIDTFRPSGPGGQHMQKTSSAVRITHLPTGIVVTCQSERSQLKNKEYAMLVLKARLLKIEMAKKREERDKIKGAHVIAGWGNQIRSYILHPYKMIKDHRTEYQTGNTEAVLDGELKGFMIAYLRAGLGKADG